MFIYFTLVNIYIHIYAIGKCLRYNFWERNCNCNTLAVSLYTIDLLIFHLGSGENKPHKWFLHEWFLWVPKKQLFGPPPKLLVLDPTSLTHPHGAPHKHTWTNTIGQVHGPVQWSELQHWLIPEVKADLVDWDKQTLGHWNFETSQTVMIKWSNNRVDQTSSKSNMIIPGAN